VNNSQPASRCFGLMRKFNRSEWTTHIRRRLGLLPVRLDEADTATLWLGSVRWTRGDRTFVASATPSYHGKRGSVPSHQNTGNGATNA
jgi:hypothetical protein